MSELLKNKVIKKIGNLAHTHRLLLASFVFFFLFSITVRVFATPLYNPGDTLSPTCAPGDLDCTVGFSNSTFSTGLTDTAGTITNDLSTGVSGGQTVSGGIDAGDALTLSSTTNATKGKIIFGISAYDEVNDRLGIGTTTPQVALDVTSLTDGVYGRFQARAGTYQAAFTFNNGAQEVWFFGKQTDDSFIVYDSVAHRYKFRIVSNGAIRLGEDGTTNVTIGSTTTTSMFNVGTSAGFRVNSTGAIVAATGITSSGTINFSGLTASTALATDASKNLISSATTSTELGYLSGVTSAIQTQLNTKGTFTLPSLTTGSVLFSNGTTTAQDNTNFFWDDTTNRLGIGTASPSAFMHVLGTTEQLRLGYDASNYLSATVGSTGSATLSLTGTSPTFRLDNAVSINTSAQPTSVLDVKYTTGGIDTLKLTDTGNWILSFYQGATQRAGFDNYGRNWNSLGGTATIVSGTGTISFNQNSVSAFSSIGTGAVAGTLQLVTGFVGVGTVPSAKLHSLATTEQLRLGYDASNYFSTTVSSIGSTTFALTGTSPTFNFSSNVGVSCADADHLLEIGGTGAGCNTGAGSYLNAAGDTTFTANSSRIWKNNIVTVEKENILELIASTPVRRYDWKPEYCEGPQCLNKIGFIAEEFYPVLEHGDDKHVNGQDVSMAEWLGLQKLIEVTRAMDSKIQGLGSLDTETIGTFGYLLKNFLADSLNTIEDLYAKVIHTDKVETKELCVGSTCITEAEFLQMVNQNGGVSTPVTPTPDPTPDPDPTPTPDPDPIPNPDQTPDVVPPGDGSTEPTPDPVIEIINVQDQAPDAPADNSGASTGGVQHLQVQAIVAQIRLLPKSKLPLKYGINVL